MGVAVFFLILFMAKSILRNGQMHPTPVPWHPYLCWEQVKRTPEGGVGVEFSVLSGNALANQNH